MEKKRNLDRCTLLRPTKHFCFLKSERKEVCERMNKKPSDFLSWSLFLQKEREIIDPNVHRIFNCINCSFINVYSKFCGSREMFEYCIFVPINITKRILLQELIVSLPYLLHIILFFFEKSEIRIIFFLILLLVKYIQPFVPLFATMKSMSQRQKDWNSLFPRVFVLACSLQFLFAIPFSLFYCIEKR